MSASDGTTTGTTNMSATVGASTQVTASVTGRLQVAMSTSFQPAEWDYQFFTNFPAAVTPLGNLEAQHIRLQPISQGIPQTTPHTWDFSIVDAITQPVLDVGDHSPEYQIAIGPPFMYDSSHNFVDPTYGQFATYAQQLVQYYNTGGFTDAGSTFHKSPKRVSHHLVGHLQRAKLSTTSDRAQYVQLYNVTVPAMQAVDPTLKFVAIELSEAAAAWSSSICRRSSAASPRRWTWWPRITTPAATRKIPTRSVFATIPGFASQVTYIRSQLATKPGTRERSGVDHGEQRERRLRRRRTT